MLFFLYEILIAPLEFVIGIVAWRLYRIFYDTGTVLIGLSLFVMLVTQPMYRGAERIKAETEAKQRVMREWEKHIRRVFKGDERMMMLSSLYRRYGYKQSSIIWSLAPLLLQIPFFMAAYNYLSESWLLEGQTFAGISDLASPDRLLHMGGITLNLLPILMTAINIISALIYHKDSEWKDRLQPLLLAVLFLVLLYDSPSRLVLYWLLNNLFSLVRNIIDRFITNKSLFYLLLSCIPLCWYCFYVVIGMGKGGVPFADGGAFILFMCLPVTYIISKLISKRKLRTTVGEKDVSIGVILLILAALAGLYGGVVPMSLMVSTPEDFVSIYQYYDPLRYVQGTLTLYFGFFVIWGSLICIMIKKDKRIIYARVMMTILFVSLIDFLFFGGIYGEFNNELVYTGINARPVEIVINAGIIIAVTFVMALLILKKSAIIKPLAVAMFFAVLIYILSGTIRIEYKLRPIKELAVKTGESIEASEIEPEIELSRNGRNVMVIMIDRAIGAYFPYILEDRPDLKERLAGSTYYPDTLSYGRYTIFASPALFGGYEYTPAAINERSGVELAQKHDEAIKLMPVIFGEAGYNVTVADLPYAGYKIVSDMSTFDEYAFVKRCDLEGKYVDERIAAQKDTERLLLRYKYYGLVRTSPLLWAEELFIDAGYASGMGELNIPKKFLDAYSVLDNLDRLTTVNDSLDNTFLLMDNNTAHEPCELQLPDYTPDVNIDNSGYSLKHSPMRTNSRADIEQYCVTVAAMLKIGEYFDYLREQGVYDNTRIIIVSDHGYPRRQFDDMLFLNGTIDAEAFNPLLLVKDFGSRELTVCNDFMTNADVPTLAFDGLIEDPVNPFTGNKINSNAKSGIHYITDSSNSNPTDGTVFDTSDAHWYAVHDSIFKEENWSVWK